MKAGQLRFALPDGLKCRALQHKTMRVLRMTQVIKQAFDGATRQQIVIFATCSQASEQSLAH